ncbi:nuclear transport factor 2 family protein [Glycomyces mayteni]|uniref:Nuclear transport factor 2 family protein n=1 Tax=Glycomyces mayteni TaxID=543887 RepID=A0ABW2D4X5_9ACTN|nr:hypothetical protein GCM10025732_27850 [Glycomyces mayteni]
MKQLNSIEDPKQFMADFYTGFTRDLLAGDEDAALVVDRYHTPDIVQVADGNPIDRQKLIDHTRPVRKNRPTIRMDVHDAVVDGDLLAARYTLHSSQRGKDVAIDVHFFGRFAPDGRMREAHMLTRAVS